MPSPTDGLKSAKFWRKEELEGEPKGKVPKSGSLYIHRTGTEYQCKDCYAFIPATERCLIHSDTAEIKAYATCGYFVKGKPLPDIKPMGYLSKLESGYTDEGKAGYSCKRCEYFAADALDCAKVDRKSPGDDPGKIHPDGCCAAWEALD